MKYNYSTVINYHFTALATDDALYVISFSMFRKNLKKNHKNLLTSDFSYLINL
jgi:hypothetical protein